MGQEPSLAEAATTGPPREIHEGARSNDRSPIPSSRRRSPISLFKLMWSTQSYHGLLTFFVNAVCPAPYVYILVLYSTIELYCKAPVFIHMIMMLT